MIRHLVVLAGWAVLSVLCFSMAYLFIAPYISHRYLYYEDLILIFGSVVSTAVAFGVLLYIPLSALIVMTLEVFDHDRHQ